MGCSTKKLVLLLLLLVHGLLLLQFYWVDLIPDKSPMFLTAPSAAKARNQHSNFSSSLFAPGSLTMSRLETFQKCYTDPKRYKPHFREVYRGRRRQTPCSISRRYNLIYHQVEKAGSSTIRTLLEKDFEAKDRMSGCLFWEDDPAPPPGNKAVQDQLAAELSAPALVHVFTAFREPTDRFYSGYQELLRRWAHPPPKKRASLPPAYGKFSDTFVNLSHTQRNEVILRGTLNASEVKYADRDYHLEIKAFEQFVKDYDALDPWDPHLRLQVPRISSFLTGRAFQGLHQIMDTKSLNTQLEALSSRLRNGNRTLSAESVYSSPKHHAVHLDELSVQTRQKLCQLNALDYCCLNYPLPTVCQGVVQCRWTQSTSETTKKKGGGVEEFLIEAVSPFPPLAVGAVP